MPVRYRGDMTAQEVDEADAGLRELDGQLRWAFEVDRHREGHYHRPCSDWSVSCAGSA